MGAIGRDARLRRSGALFNNRHFADVVAAALEVSDAGTNMFTTRMVASLTGLADSVVRPVLHRLVDASVLAKLPRAGGGRSAQYYQVLETATLRDIRSLTEPGPGVQPSDAPARRVRGETS